MALPAGDDAEGLGRLFAPLCGASTLLVAVSGGPDSVALMHLLARWRAVEGRPCLAAATVDHGLRPGSAAEAEQVGRQAAALGIPHSILAWTGPKPASGVQAAARQARYMLLRDHAERLGATHLATAHTLDDQAETILMRLSRGSGLAGLSGMRQAVDRQGLCHVRPLLGVAKADLVDVCRQEGWAFVEDPSNVDDRFARARWRKLLPALSVEGLTAGRLARLAERAARAEEALDAKARYALSRAQALEGRAPDHFLARGLRDEPFEIAVRMLALALRAEPDEAEHLRLERLERALVRLREALAEAKPLRLTLARRVLDLDRAGYLRIQPEPPRHRGRYPGVEDNTVGGLPSTARGRRPVGDQAASEVRSRGGAADDPVSGVRSSDEATRDDPAPGVSSPGGACHPVSDDAAVEGRSLGKGGRDA